MTTNNCTPEAADGLIEMVLDLRAECLGGDEDSDAQRLATKCLTTLDDLISGLEEAREDLEQALALCNNCGQGQLIFNGFIAAGSQVIQPGGYWANNQITRRGHFTKA